ncbi:hypothetical protein [Mammaliicoccus sp. P-M59]|uniref:hypothetical protein n=1 Tax=Mammaliicoccus sp. P-M59 TaxID=2898718 RepID=UPI001EFAC231|nr:hypothetical protein [Mammaliicoccus sp. P-M59]
MKNNLSLMKKHENKTSLIDKVFTNENKSIIKDFVTINKEVFEVLEQHMKETFTYEDLIEEVKKSEVPPNIKDLNEKMVILIKEIKENMYDIRYDKKEIIALLTE